MFTRNMTVANLREVEEIATMVADISAKVAENMADAILSGAIQITKPDEALRHFATAIRKTMASEFSVGSVH